MRASLRYAAAEHSAMMESSQPDHAGPRPAASGFIGLRWLPFVVLAGAVLVVLSSQPGAASPAGPLMGVRVLLLVIGLALAVFLEVTACMLQSRQRLAAGYDASPQTARAILDATAGITRVLNVALASFMTFLAAPLRGLTPGRSLTLGLVILLAAIAWGGWALKSLHGELGRAGQLGGLEGWNGIIYDNPRDPRLWVPKISGFGTTLNFAHRKAWVLLGSILALSLAAAAVGIVSAFCR